ncbi:DNA (cytosine-5-)-methyltransferase [Sunxiuqinia indica]|uniref:DNA (cytosine-5-)-methyltransferase n=1 Tax=Sunxiuqinia indica TaxID=2692584 RepID=UPI00135B557A|nr:DNA (cytosine-5-)-methyltransferase [Sunxiuqinia indica]
MLNHASLFSGIGGFDLAAEWMGWNNVFHCEWNEFGQKVLKYYWPKAKSYGDITQTDFTIWRNKIDILTGGFPCQPYSVAGKRLGKEDERHLWPEMLRAIREISPSYVVGENVYGLLSWNGGLVFDEVQADLEAEGYKVQPVVLPACGQNAPHKRERVWFIAYSTSQGRKEWQQNRGRKDKKKNGAELEFRHKRFSNNGIIANTDNDGQHGSKNGQSDNKGNDNNQTRANTIKQLTGCCSPANVANTGCSEWENGVHGEEQGREATKFGDSYTKFGQFTKFPNVEPTICGGNDGVSGKLDGITFSKWRNESIKAYGNAIVPQVAYVIFKAIQATAFSGEVQGEKQ